jgi:polyisoprenyl-phosphate glycosyltransferase
LTEVDLAEVNDFGVHRCSDAASYGSKKTGYRCACSLGKLSHRMVEDLQSPADVIHRVSVVVPVYQGERTLDALAGEVEPLIVTQTTSSGRRFHVAELLLVYDGAIDGSSAVMKSLAAKYPFVRVVWLSRNFGQHAATLAGMASTVAEWVVTLDEDGQQDPRDIAKLLDYALERRARLAYARPTNAPPHGFVRNAFSAMAKLIFVRVLGARIGAFSSFRLIEGEVARGVAAYCGANVYLDVALSWVVETAVHCPVEARNERGRGSGYTTRRLLRHFWQLVLSSGTMPLRLISLLGVLSVILAFIFSSIQVWNHLQHQIPVQGWTSLVIIVSFFGGVTLVSVGIIAEYLGFAVSMAMGKPAYLIVSRPRDAIGNKS